MSSSVFFRFKSQKEPSRVTFDGTGISVFELKREIITVNRLGDGTDFELMICSEDTNEAYDDDTFIIPRSTSVIAKRLPASKQGRGGAARYISGKMPQNSKNSHRAEVPSTKSVPLGKSANTPSSLLDMTVAQTEEEKIAAMFKMGADQWAQQQQEMANVTPIHRGGPMKGKAINVPDRPPPSGYICYRCGEKGHWIQVCPTNDDPTFDGRPRVKRTTGIPRSFLKTVERPVGLANDGTTDDTKQPSGVMVNAEGEWVVAEPDKASWDQYQAKAKVSAAAQEAVSRGSKELQERGLECSIDKRLYVEPTKIPCCQTTYCLECITNVLIENGLRCPECSTDNISIDNLIPDGEMAATIREYEQEKNDAQTPSKEGSKSPSTKDSLQLISTQEKPASSTGNALSKASTPISNPLTNGTAKKRPAEAEIKNERVPPGPNVGSMKRNSSDTGPKPPITGQPPRLPSDMSFTNQLPFANGNLLLQQQGLNSMAFPNVTGYMGMPMGTSIGTTMGMPVSMAPLMTMGPGMQDPMMMQAGAFAGPSGNNWNNTWMGTGFAPQSNGMNGPGYHNGVVAHGSYGQFNGQMPPGNGFMGSHGMIPNGQAKTTFANQQRNTFSAPTPNEEDSAYFRKPVNPHRHQARRNINRPTDYREI